MVSVLALSLVDHVSVLALSLVDHVSVLALSLVDHVSVLALSLVDHEFELHSDQTKYTCTIKLVFASLFAR
jgi:hypothetical protein